MPLYQYQCRECGFDLETRQKFSDEPLTECPNCGAAQGLFRVVQAAGIVFKGSGFYVTDSRGNRENLTSATKKKGDDSSSSTSNGGEAGSKSSGDSSSSDSSAPASTPAAEKKSSPEKKASSE